MKREDLRAQTCLVIEKDGKYLAGYRTFLGTVRWDDHLSYAWRTRDKEEALRVAEEFGGTVMLFNPIIWRTKKL